MIRLSIIIPFYNVEKYIAQCLDSVYQQDIPEEEYEVICVNDASPDHSRDIVLEYQRKHTNLVLVEHDVNKKLGAARNTGRTVARGNYIWNVDSDDMIVPNCLGGILDRCERNELDVLLFCNNRLQDGEIRENPIMWNECIDPVSGVDFWKSQCLKNPGGICPIWQKIFRTKFLEENRIYSPNINMGEDIPFSIESILLAKRVQCCNDVFIVIRNNSESLTRLLRKAPSPKIVYENSFVCGKNVHMVAKRIPSTEKEIFKSVLSLEKYILQSYSSYLERMTKIDISELRKICRQNLFTDYFALKVFGFRKALKYLLFVLFGYIV